MRAALLTQAAAPALQQQQAPHNARSVTAFAAGRVQQRQQRASRSGVCRRAVQLVCMASAPAAEGKLISKVEIPAFIPRSDLVDQLLRWALIEVQENGVAAVGAPCKVTPYMRGDDMWGFTVSFLKDGESATDLRVAFDGESITKHDWVGRGADGFPTLEGNSEEIYGKDFEVRKMCDRPVSEPLRACIREFCTMLVSAVNKYYAFGSCFADDST